MTVLLSHFKEHSTFVSKDGRRYLSVNKATTKPLMYHAQLTLLESKSTCDDLRERMPDQSLQE
jgi:hypothetical protein